MRRARTAALLATAVLAALALASSGCRYGALFAENLGVLVTGPKRVEHKIRHPFRPDARLALCGSVTRRRSCRSTTR